jgi:hypothetical protein
MNFVSTENPRPSFRELTASTEKRRGGPLPPPPPGVPRDGTHNARTGIISDDTVIST